MLSLQRDPKSGVLLAVPSPVTLQKPALCPRLGWGCWPHRQSGHLKWFQAPLTRGAEPDASLCGVQPHLGSKLLNYR